MSTRVRSFLNVLSDAHFSEEHYRRSSDCSFFVFAPNPGKKAKSTRGRKPRSSKVSRLSTQSATSVEPSDDFGYQTDQSIMSDASTKPKNVKKSTKSRSKASKSRKADVEDTDEQIEVDVTEDASPEPKQKRAARGKKRPSDQVDQGDFDGPGSVSPAPATKKRATRTRGSAMRQASVDIDDSASVMTQEQYEVAPHEEEPKKSRRTTKKDSSTRGRKASDASSTAKAPSKSRIPDDAELDAKLEADLEQDARDYGEPEEPTEKVTKSTSKKSKTKKSKAQPEPPVEDVEVPEDEAEEVPDEDEVEPVEPESRPQAKSNKSASKQKVKGSKSKEREPKSRASPEDTRPSVPERHEPEKLSDAESIDEVKTKKPKKAPSDKTTKSKKTSNQPTAVPKPKEEIIDVEDSADEEPAEADINIPGQEEMSGPPVEEEEDQDEEDEQVESRPSRHQSSNHPHKTTERYSDIPHEQQFAKSLTESQGSGAQDEHSNTRRYDRQANGTVSPIPSGLKSTPSLSPQSSDAENQPPSTKPSASRDHAPSPSKLAPERAPLAGNTPSPSKERSNTGGVESSQAWTPIDIEAILSAGDIEKENVGKPTADLTSLEKKMSVEEWIQWQAKNGEERLKQECERLVSHFEKEGGRAMRMLESIECID